METDGAIVHSSVILENAPETLQLVHLMCEHGLARAYLKQMRIKNMNSSLRSVQCGRQTFYDTVHKIK